MSYRMIVARVQDMETCDAFWPSFGFTGMNLENRIRLTLEVNYQTISEIEHLECESFRVLLAKIAKILNVTIKDADIADSQIIFRVPMPSVNSTHVWFLMPQKIEYMTREEIRKKKLMFWD